MRCSSTSGPGDPFRRRFHHALPRGAFFGEGDLQGLLDAIDIVLTGIRSTCCTVTTIDPEFRFCLHTFATQKLIWRGCASKS